MMQGPHGNRNVASVQFMHNEPVLISTSDDDNSIKMWFFEKGTTQPRLLKERCGHATPPTKSGSTVEKMTPLIKEQEILFLVLLTGP